MLELIRSEVEAARAAARLPGVAVLCQRGNGPIERLFVGGDADGGSLDETTLFPVASVTKLATALAVLRLVDRGKLAVDDGLGQHLPDAAAAREGVTLRRLLSHTAGLPLDLAPERAPYALGLDWPALGAACLATAAEREPAASVQYSNVGYGLLALVVERTTGQPFPNALASLVLEPLGVEGYLGAEPPRPPARLADVRGDHAGTETEPFNSAFWRSLALPWGGLVTTADGALALVRAFYGHPSGFLALETRAEALRNQAGLLGGGLGGRLSWPSCPWGLGPELRGAKTPHWSPSTASASSFGHAGASGCVAWIDPERDLAWFVAGTRTFEGGWLVRQGAAIGDALLSAASRSS